MTERYFLSWARLFWREWGAEFVVYDERHAVTHLIDSGASAVLKLLLNSNLGCTIDELAEGLFVDPIDPFGADALTDAERSSLQLIIARLVRLELVESRRS